MKQKIEIMMEVLVAFGLVFLTVFLAPWATYIFG